MKIQKIRPVDNLEESEFAVVRKLAPLLRLVSPSGPTPPQPLNIDERLIEWAKKVQQVFNARLEHRERRWSWGAASEHLYSALIRALNLHEDEAELLEIARRLSRPGRKENKKIAALVHRMQDEGLTARASQQALAKDGENLSQEAVESYRKTRRRTQQ